MKTKTHVLKTAEGKIVHTAYPWDDQRNRDYNKKRLEAKFGPLKWHKGKTVETMSP